MALEIYRRHSKKKCTTKSTSDSKCSNSRKPCPVWICGTQADGTFIRQTLDTRDWQLAGKMRDEWNSRGAKIDGPAPKATIEDLKTRFLANMKTLKRDKATIKKYEVLFRHIERFAQREGWTLVSQLDLAQLEMLRSEWKDQSVSLARKQSRLRRIFRYALDHKMIDENPAQKLEKIPVSPIQHEPFTDEELKRIYDAALADKNPLMYPLILVMRFTGLRISDAVGLQVKHIINGCASLQTRKRKTDVVVPLHEPVLQALERVKRASPEYFFWDGVGDVIQAANYYRDEHFKRVFKAAKIKGHPRPHAFRHTFASHLLRAGASYRQVAKFLGNSAKVVEQYYSKWVPEEQENANKIVRKANGFHELPSVVNAAGIALANVVQLKRRKA